VLTGSGGTRADARLLKRYANEIVNRLPSPDTGRRARTAAEKRRAGFLESTGQAGSATYTTRLNFGVGLGRVRKRNGQIDLVNAVRRLRETYLEGFGAVATRRGLTGILARAFSRARW